MSGQQSAQSSPLRRLIPPLLLLLLVIALPYQGIQWGDGLEFVAVSKNLGIAHPPGYPLFTLLAWLFLNVPTKEPYVAVLLLCRLIAWGGALVIAGLTTAALRRAELASPYEVPIGWATAAIVLFSPLMLPFLHGIEIYTLQSLLVVGVIGALFTEDPLNLRRWLIAGTCFGLAVANHLPGLSLGPLLLLVAVRDFRRGGGVLPPLLAGVVAAALPVCLYASLLLRTLSGNEWGIAWGNPASLPDLIAHVRGGEYATYQFLQLAPGMPMTFDVWLQFVGLRIGQTSEALSDLIPFGGALGPVIALLALAATILGGVTLWRTQRSWVAGILLAAGAQWAFISTYNIPDIRDYFLPLFVLFVPMLIVGIARAVPAGALALGALLLLVPLSVGVALLRQEPAMELPGLYKARLLETLPPDCSFIPATDADLFTMWYAQHAVGERLDVAVVSSNFMRFPWFRYSVVNADPRRDAVQFLPGPPPLGMEVFIDQLAKAQVAPLLEHGRVFWSSGSPAEIHAMQRHYRVTPVEELLALEELLLIQSAGWVNFAPPILYEIEKR